MSDRRARLAALAARAGRDTSRDVNPEESSIGNPEHTSNDASTTAMEAQAQAQSTAVKFRNYAPQDETLEKTEQLSESEPPTKRIKSDQKPQEGEQQEQETSELEKAVREAKADAVRVMQQTASISTVNPSAALNMAMTTSMAPKKVNWDLKRDITKKMNRLERRTQKALVELLRQRLEQEAEMEVDNDGNLNDDLD